MMDGCQTTGWVSGVCEMVGRHDIAEDATYTRDVLLVNLNRLVRLPNNKTTAAAVKCGAQDASLAV
jgi:hypothetical protein